MLGRFFPEADRFARALLDRTLAMSAIQQYFWVNDTLETIFEHVSSPNA